jgi:hypothetical protein
MCSNDDRRELAPMKENEAVATITVKTDVASSPLESKLPFDCYSSKVKLHRLQYSDCLHICYNGDRRCSFVIIHRSKLTTIMPWANAAHGCCFTEVNMQFSNLDFSKTTAMCRICSYADRWSNFAKLCIVIIVTIETLDARRKHELSERTLGDFWES